MGVKQPEVCPCSGYVVELEEQRHSLSPSPLTSGISQMLLGIFALPALNACIWQGMWGEET